MPYRILLLADPAPGHAGTVLDHIEALSTDSRHYVYVINPLGWALPDTIAFDEFDIVVIHYSIAIIHLEYLPTPFRNRIRAFRGPKAIFIQDEYRDVNAYTASMLDLGIDVVFTCVPDDAIDAVYRPLHEAGVEVIPTLPGFVPDALTKHPVRPLADRSLDIIYRGRSLPYELGELAREKTRIGVGVKRRAEEHGLTVDIEWCEAARIYGPAWPNFISSGRAMLGTESGASIVDFDGHLATEVKAYREATRYADYHEVAETILRPYEGKVVIKTIPPRAFEAICLGTALVLFPGHYSGILTPGRHYIPLEKDFSNIDEVARLLRDLPFLEHLTRVARADIVDSGRYSFATFTRQVDETMARLFEERYPLRAQNAMQRNSQDRASWWREFDTKFDRYCHPAQKPIIIRFIAWLLWRCLPGGSFDFIRMLYRGCRLSRR